MTTITIVRHGETEWNLAGLQQGHLDSKLTERGRAQAEHIATALKGKRCNVIYSSDLGRARETAEIIAKELGKDIIIDKGLRERHLGIMQGLTMEQFEQEYPRQYDRFMSGDLDYNLEGGESKSQRYERHVECLQRMALKNGGCNVLVVAHGGVLDSIFCYVLGITLEKERTYSLLNSSLNTFIVEDGKWKLKTWGDISHLEDVDALDDF